MAVFLALWPWAAQGGQAVKMAVRNQGPQVEIRWPAQMAIPGCDIRPDFELRRSFDLQHWETLPFTNASSNDAEILAIVGDPSNPSGFYRVTGSLDNALANLGPIQGADVLGFSGQFSRELRRIGQISTAQFSALYPQPTNYLDKISWDPTQSKYWDRVMKSQFQLSAEEMGVFTNGGMVVSERLGGYSFADVFYRIYSSDLPVFISTDAILHAWHRTFVRVLQELEQTSLSYALSGILDNMSYGLNSVRAKVNLQQNAALRPVFDNSIDDADFFLTVARSLMAGATVTSQFGQDARVASALKAIQAEAYVENFDLFDAPRAIDFSQFKPRGHYADSAALQRYFRAMMWCGRIDLRIAGRTYSKAREEDTVRQLATALVLNESLRVSGATQDWANANSILQAFVGHTDSMTFGQLTPLMNAAGLTSFYTITNSTILTNLQRSILLGQIGAQDIRGTVFYSPLSPEQIVLPRSFTVMGQRFVLDSWALSQVVFDSIVWDPDGVPEFEDKVQRRIPSGLDIAFGVLGNNQFVGELVSRIENPGGRKFRDGLPYQHNLAAIRSVVDKQKSTAWTDNVYVNWLSALRDLSAPTTGAVFPEAMRTRAWAMKSLNTQLASWTQLRHDTVLNAKQSYTAPVMCDYPYGFVEPVPAFWQRLKQMAERTASMMNVLPVNGSITVSMESSNYLGQPIYVNIDLMRLRGKLSGHFMNFSQTCAQLQGIAEKELAQKPMYTTDIEFMKNVMENHTGYMSYKVYDGWYPSLFYASELDGIAAGEGKGSDKWDALVTDVHTDVPEPLVDDPGCVLHEGVGNVHLMMIAVENGPDRMVFTGPVLSHYEFEMEGIQRKTDAEWKADVKSGSLPPHPEWTRGYLVPGRCPVPPNVD
jgi:hypothetical protein